MDGKGVPHRCRTSPRSIGPGPLPDIQMKIYLSRGDVLIVPVLADHLKRDTFFDLPFMQVRLSSHYKGDRFYIIER